MEKLQCPFCDGIGAVHDDESAVSRHHSNEALSYQIFCKQCDACGPWSFSEDEAWKRWNERSENIEKLNGRLISAMSVIDLWAKVDDLICNDETAPVGIQVSEIALARLQHYKKMVQDLAQLQSVREPNAWDAVAAFIHKRYANKDIPQTVLFHLQVLDSFKTSMRSFESVMIPQQITPEKDI